MLLAWGLGLRPDQDGRGFGVVGIFAVLALLLLVLNDLWRRDRRRKAARDRALADRLLERIYQHRGEPINLTRLARQVHLHESAAKDLLEGKLVKDGYLHRKRRQRKHAGDREDRLLLSPSAPEAMRHRNRQRS
jgi:hypothetical protein